MHVLFDTAERSGHGHQNSHIVVVAWHLADGTWPAAIYSTSRIA